MGAGHWPNDERHLSARFVYLSDYDLKRTSAHLCSVVFLPEYSVTEFPLILVGDFCA